MEMHYAENRHWKYSVPHGLDHRQAVPLIRAAPIIACDKPIIILEGKKKMW